MVKAVKRKLAAEHDDADDAPEMVSRGESEAAARLEDQRMDQRQAQKPKGNKKRGGRKQPLSVLQLPPALPADVLKAAASELNALEAKEAADQLAHREAKKQDFLQKLRHKRFAESTASKSSFQKRSDNFVLKVDVTSLTEVLNPSSAALSFAEKIRGGGCQIRVSSRLECTLYFPWTLTDR